MDHTARGDPEEGEARHREFRPDRLAIALRGGSATVVASPGDVTVHGEIGNYAYICCLTAPPDDAAWDRVRKEFGNIVVEISDPEQLIADLRAAAQQNDPWQRGPIGLWPVSYNEGELLSSTEDKHDPMRRAVTQKTHEYSYQHEQRIVLISHGVEQVNGPPPDPLYIRLPKALTYARILWINIAAIRS
ncbi:MAG: hypothetical protein WDO12_01585 [Pseudomonadota bacterium]